MDLYSRAIVGWSMNRRMTQQLVCDALTMALFRRHFPKGTIIHSDRGSQYCSKRYQRLIKNNGLRCSMGRRATCYDNAAMESFFHTLKVEFVHRERYITRRMAKSSIFEYIETYYNRQRKHSRYRASDTDVIRQDSLTQCPKSWGRITQEKNSRSAAQAWSRRQLRPVLALANLPRPELQQPPVGVRIIQLPVSIRGATKSSQC